MDASTSDPNQSGPQKPDQQPPMDQNDTTDLNPQYTRARIFLFILLPILILLFNTNTIIVSIITTMLILLGIPMFEFISKYILKYIEILLYTLGKPFELIRSFLFVKHPTSLGSWLKRHRRSIIDSVAIIAIVILLGATTLNPLVTTVRSNLSDDFCLHGWPWFSCNSGLGVTTLPNGVRIGLIASNTSDGPFDQSTLNAEEKHAEDLIFKENNQACTGPHITLVVVTMLSRTVENPQNTATLGLQHLQGDFLAQNRYNHTGTPALPLCLAIANLGTADTANINSPVVTACPSCYSMPQVMHQIAQFAQADPSVHGIVGFPFSQQVKEALQIINDNEQSLASLPIISPSASSDNFSNRANFYRIDLPNQSQAGAMAQFFCSHLVKNQPSPPIAILTDSNDPFSGDLAIDFQNDVNCTDPAKKFPSITYKNGDSTSIERAVDEALQHHVSYIFFPGYDQDLDTVEKKVYQVLQSRAKTVTIIGGDGINDVDATTHYAYTLVYAANFTQPVPKTEPFAQAFIEYQFPPPYKTQIPAIQPSDFWMPADVFLNIDAVQAFTKTLQNLPNTNFTQSDFNNTLQSITFQGETGNITFQGNKVNSRHISDRTAGSVYITCYDDQHILHLIDSYSATIDTGLIQENTSIPNTSACS